MDDWQWYDFVVIEMGGLDNDVECCEFGVFGLGSGEFAGNLPAVLQVEVGVELVVRELEIVDATLFGV